MNLNRVLDWLHKGSARMQVTEKKPYIISLREGYRPEVRDISEKRASPENNPLLSCWPRFS